MDSIKRRKTTSDYTVLNNHFLKNKSLSWKAKGLISYIMMLPDDWKLNMKDLQNRSTDGRDSLMTGMKELIEEGYCQRTLERDNHGIISGYQYEITDTPEFKNEPETENPSTVKPSTDKPETVKPDTDNQHLLITNKEENTKEEKKPGVKTPDSLFPESEVEQIDKTRKTLFSNSVYKDFNIFELKFKSPEYEKVDLFYYFTSVKNWSDKSDKKRTARGWIATAQDFMRGDNEKKKLKLKPEFTGTQNRDSMMEYLKGY